MLNDNFTEQEIEMIDALLEQEAESMAVEISSHQANSDN